VGLMLSKKNLPVYDLFELMNLMESKGFMSKQKYWQDYILESYNIYNGIYIDAYFGDGNDEELNKYHREVRNLLGISNEETVIMKVSW
jgi:hypothetical protein